jgi:hypothetical protein
MQFVVEMAKYTLRLVVKCIADLRIECLTPSSNLEAAAEVPGPGIFPPREVGACQPVTHEDRCFAGDGAGAMTAPVQKAARAEPFNSVICSMP